MKDPKQEILNRYGLGMPIKSLAHVCIKSVDLDATTEFYCGALGMSKHFNFTKNGKIIGFYMKAASDTFIEVFLADQVDGIEKHVINHFCLETDDIEALRKSLVARGYTPGPSSSAPISRPNSG